MRIISIIYFLNSPVQVSGDAASAAKRGRLTRKHILIGVISLLVVVLVVTAVLVGVKIYTLELRDCQGGNTKPCCSSVLRLRNTYT